MLIVGLTGGIATGKSTVADIFEELGAYRIDTDRLARLVVEPHQPVWEAVVLSFGTGVLSDSGSLDRKKLAAIIFADPEKREVLNKLTHPAVRTLLREELAHARQQGVGIVLVEVPLLYEAGFDCEVDCVIVVKTTEKTQLARLLSRENLSEEAARLRIEAQMPLQEKMIRADYQIDNEGSPSMTREQAEKVWQLLRQKCSND
ncbi:MAG: Dephospho-CoA kinase [Dehalococcoidia bacterium]|nr:Dephospho-CoA kinase [Bacillota bacterium]MBT9143515.1 Dephospho-CoA kinase [Bacillota bacterium]